MGKATGMAKDLSGKVGNLVFKQQPDGSTNVSSLPKPSEKPDSHKQLAVKQDTQITSQFIKSVEDFIKVSYEPLARSKNQNQNNAMASHIRKNTLMGEYPDREIDLNKVLFSQGKMEIPKNATVGLNEAGFSFTWNSEINPGIHYSDQVMLMAYFPELKAAMFKTGGAERREGKDILKLEAIENGYEAHVYIAFISNDHKSVSNSVYLGQLTW